MLGAEFMIIADNRIVEKQGAKKPPVARVGGEPGIDGEKISVN